MNRAECGCYVFKVWRMGRVGHVSRREAGVFYCTEPEEFYGPLATFNTVHLRNPYFQLGDWEDLYDKAGLGNAQEEFFKPWWKIRGNGEEVFRLIYPLDCKIANYVRDFGCDGIVYIKTKTDIDIGRYKEFPEASKVCRNLLEVSRVVVL